MGPSSEPFSAPDGGGFFYRLLKRFLDVRPSEVHAVKSPYLLQVGLYILLFTVTSTFLYFQQAEIARASFADRGARTAFARVDLAVNVLTLGAQLFLTARLLRALGVAVTLAALSAVSILGFGSLAALPTIAVLVVYQVLRRAGNFAFERPSREVLFTVVPREDKYKAKSFIDTFVYRLGDQVGAWSYAGLGLLGTGLEHRPCGGAHLNSLAPQ